MAINWAPLQPTLGQTIGTGLGAGLGTGLQGLAEMKLQQMAQARRSEQLRPVLEQLGLPKNFELLDPQVQARIVQQRAIEERTMPLLSQIQGILGVMQPDQRRVASPINQEIPEEVISPRQAPFSLERPESPQDIIRKAVSGESALEQIQGATLPFDQTSRPTRTPIQAPPEVDVTTREAEAPIGTTSNELSQEELLQLASAVASNDPKQLQKAVRDIYKERRREEFAQKKIKAAELREERKEELDLYKLSKAERSKIVEGAKSARNTLHDLDRLEELQNTGKLDTPGYVEFLERVGLDVPALMNPESQEFRKIQQTFMRDARKYFGARVTNFELDQFLKSIPSLSQSPEGRKRVLANLKRVNRVALLYNDEYKKMLRENGWKLPMYWEEKLDDKLTKKLDKLSTQFKKDLAKPTPPAQNRLVTALQATLGSILGAPGKLLKGAGNLISGGAGAEAIAAI